MLLHSNSASRLRARFIHNKKISESGESGVWDSLGGFRWKLRKIEMKLTLEMKLTFMLRLCHEFDQGVSLANAAWLKTLKIFCSPLKKNAVLSALEGQTPDVSACPDPDSFPGSRLFSPKNRTGLDHPVIQSWSMPEKCTWITFHAHPTKFVKEEDHHPDFFGVFVCPTSRRDPEHLLEELLTNRKLLLTEIRSNQLKAQTVDWGMNERLKAEIDDHGYGLALTKMHYVTLPAD
jgi:hypothetical protein